MRSYIAFLSDSTRALALFCVILVATSVTAQVPDSTSTQIRAKLDSIAAATTAIRTMLPTPNPATVGLSGAQLVGDNFATYAGTAALKAKISSTIGGTASSATAIYQDGTNVSLIELDTTVKYNGHATMKYNMPGGVSTTPWLSVYFPGGKTLTKMWYRVKIRFSPGFTTIGTLTNSANAYKLLGWSWNTYDGSGRLEITNTNQYQLYWNIQAKTTGTLVGGGVYGTAGNITTEWTDGRWYVYVIFVDFSTPQGVAKVWMAPDGSPPVLKATSASSMRDGSALPGLVSVMLGLNFNQVRAPTQAQAVWFGQWEVVDGSMYPNPFNLTGI